MTTDDAIGAMENTTDATLCGARVPRRLRLLDVHPTILTGFRNNAKTFPTQSTGNFFLRTTPRPPHRRGRRASRTNKQITTRMWCITFHVRTKPFTMALPSQAKIFKLVPRLSCTTNYTSMSRTHPTRLALHRSDSEGRRFTGIAEIKNL